MKSLYEELSRMDLQSASQEALRGAVIIRADNVIEYMLADKTGFADVVKRLPIVTPPFPTVWIEFSVRSEYAKIHNGYLIVRERTADGKIMAPENLIPPDAEWTIYAQAFSRSGEIKQNGSYIHLEDGRAPVEFLLFLRSDGTIIGDQLGVYTSYTSDFSRVLKQNHAFDLSVESEREMFAVALFALALLNCKNVTLDAVDPPAAIKHRNRHDRPAVRYQVLKIRPMSTHTRGGGEWHGGSVPSIHIRRGHFKNYQEGAGLFGKIHGLYWWENTVIGKSADSVVEKDYDIDL